MRCLGPAIIDHIQQRALERGEGLALRNKPEVMFPDAAERAQVGDSFWVKEPWFLIEATRKTKPYISQKIPGSAVHYLAVPEDLKPWWHDFRKTPCHRDAVRQLHRAESRAYLVITEIVEGGFRCSSHMQNIDDYLKSLGSKAA